MFLDEYSVLDGQWEVAQGHQVHQDTSLSGNSNLLKAKRYCSKEGKCFGFMVRENSGSVFSFNFPFRLIQQQQDSYSIHKKESVSGNIFKTYNEDFKNIRERFE